MISKRKTILFVTSSRSDFATIEPLLSRLRKDSSIRPLLWVTGDHTRKEAGETYKEIKKSGFKIDAMHPVTGTSSAIVGSIVEALGKFMSAHKVDGVLLCGDRVETLAAAVAAALARVPIFHIHGGDVSFGVVDDAMRHAITKLASIHFSASPLSAARIRQMGEESWRVHMTGSPDLDGLKTTKEGTVLKQLKLQPQKFALLLLNPESDLGDTGNRAVVKNIVTALERSYDGAVVILYPNNDPGAAGIRKEYGALFSSRFQIHRTLPRDVYLTLLRHAEFLIGNSSSGIIEAATFKTPVINVGKRQDGRERNRNVVDVPANVAQLKRAIETARGQRFRSSLTKIRNVYGDGNATEKIVRVLQETLRRYSTSELLYKKFILV